MKIRKDRSLELIKIDNFLDKIKSRTILEMEGVVYFIGNKKHHIVKIGFSTNAEQRLYIV